MKKLTSKVDGFTLVNFYFKVITSDVIVEYKQVKSSSEGITFWERLRDTETFWQISLLWTSGTFCPSTVYKRDIKVFEGAAAHSNVKQFASNWKQ